MSIEEYRNPKNHLRGVQTPWERLSEVDLYNIEEKSDDDWVGSRFVVHGAAYNLDDKDSEFDIVEELTMEESAIYAGLRQRIMERLETYHWRNALEDDEPNSGNSDQESLSAGN